MSYLGSVPLEMTHPILPFSPPSAFWCLEYNTACVGILQVFKHLKNLLHGSNVIRAVSNTFYPNTSPHLCARTKLSGYYKNIKHLDPQMSQAELNIIS